MNRYTIYSLFNVISFIECNVDVYAYTYRLIIDIKADATSSLAVVDKELKFLTSCAAFFLVAAFTVEESLTEHQIHQWKCSACTDRCYQRGSKKYPIFG